MSARSGLEELRFDDGIPSRDAVVALYRAVGWTAYVADLDRLMKGIEGSAY